MGIEDVDLYDGTRPASAAAVQKHFSPEEIKAADLRTRHFSGRRHGSVPSEGAAKSIHENLLK